MPTSRLLFRYAAAAVAVGEFIAASASGQTVSPTWTPYRNESVRELPEPPSAPASNSPGPTPAAAQYAQYLAESPLETEITAVDLADARGGLVGVADSPMLVMPIDYDSNPANWQWRLLPADVIWSSYWAGAHEPRIGAAWYSERTTGASLLDATLGGRASLVRYGTEGGGRRPNGWELQVEGAAIPRLNFNENWDLEATDFRIGAPLVYGRDNWQWKLSYYHLSSHMGDEFAIREGALAQRINFSRDALATAIAFYPLPAWRWYAEAAWAFHYDGGSEPWEFQFGVDVAEPGPTGPAGTPFIAVNGHLREEHNFGGNVVAQAGWLWRGPQMKVLRIGAHYYNGKSSQFEFFDRFEHQIGGGVWYDF